MLSWDEYRQVRYKYFGEKRQQARESYKTYRKHYGMDIKTAFPNTHYTVTVPCSLADCKTQSCPQPATDYKMNLYRPTNTAVVLNQEEGNNPMSAYASATVAAATTETQDQRKYLSKRLDEVYSEKRAPLEAKFGLIDDDAPVSVDEFKKRIADGAFTFRTGDEYRYWHWTEMVQWRSPDRKRDDEGFAAARKELKAKKQEALDIIKIDEPKAGLEAIKALEAWEPTGAAN